MNSLRRRRDLSLDKNDPVFAEPPVAIPAQARSDSLKFWKKCSVLVVVLVAIIATAGWLYLIASSIGAFVL